MRKIHNLKQLPTMMSARRECYVQIEGDEFIITLKRIPYKEWRAIDDSVAVPMPFVNLNTVTGKRDFEMNHPQTISANTKRSNKVSVMRLAASIVEDFPGHCKTLEEKADYLEEIFDELTIANLYAEIEELNAKTIRPSDMSPRQFHGAGDNGTVGDEKVESSSF